MALSPRLETIAPRVLALRAPLLARVLWASVTVLMTAVMIASSSVTVLPVVIAALALLGALFTESWYFDAEQREIRRVTGVLPVVRTITVPLDEIERVQVTTYSRGRGRTAFRRLVLVPAEGRHLVVDMVRGDGDGLEEKARLLAQHLEVDLRLE